MGSQKRDEGYKIIQKLNRDNQKTVEGKETIPRINRKSRDLLSTKNRKKLVLSIKGKSLKTKYKRKIRK